MHLAIPCKLQRGLTAVNLWCEHWKIKISEWKTHTIYFSRRPMVPEDVIQLNGRGNIFVNNVLLGCSGRTTLRRGQCDTFGGTSDMNAATQRPGTDFGASYATVFRIHGTEKYKSIATQCLQAERVLPWQRILLPVKSPPQPNYWNP
jgi:hypothetical protein